MSAQDFNQTLEWSADSNVLEYKIEVQDSSGKVIQSLKTENNFIKLSLGEGSYKYKITAYDFLGREAVSTEWIKLDVLIAKQPAIEHNKNLEALQEDGKTLEFDVEIEDVTSDTVAELVNIETNETIKGKLILAPAVDTPAAGLSASETHKADKVSFDEVPEGKWKLVVTNPSGLSSETEGFEVKDVLKEEKLAAAKAEEERLAREKKELEERLAREEAERKEAERIAAQIAAEKAAAEEAERIRQEQFAAEKAQEERIAREEQERKERELAEEAAREEAERLAREEAEREEEERLAREAAEEEERLAREAEEEELKKEKKAKRKEKWLTYDRKFTITVGAGDATVIYGNEIFKNYMEDTPLNLSLDANIGYLPFHSKSGRVRFGMDFNAMATRFISGNYYYSLELRMLLMQENLALRIGDKSKKVWFQVKAGAGMCILQEILDYVENSGNNNREDKTKNYGYFTAGGGLSVMFTPSPMFLIELGADFYNLFIPDMNMGLLNPYLGIGIRF